MNQEVVLTCAVTGGHNDIANHPNYPVTPEQIAKECLAARQAGAAIVHIHVRDPETGVRSGDPALFREVVERIRDSGSDVIINLTTSEGARFTPSVDDACVGGAGSTLVQPLQRLVHIEELRPEICTLDMGTFNFGEIVFVNTAEHLRIMSERIKQLGVKPEMEVFELGHIMFARGLIEQGLVEQPPLFQICLGIPHAAPAMPSVMTMMHNLIPRNSRWGAFGISRWEFWAVALAVTHGGNVRVGLEDNLYLSKDVFASNAQLVEKAVSVIRGIGADVVEPGRARELIGLS